MNVTVLVSSGLTNAYRSVLSARGSWLISGASEWLDALAALGPGKPVRIAASANAPNASAAATATGFGMRGTAACMGSVPPSPRGLSSLVRSGAANGSLRVDAGAGAACERVGESGGGGGAARAAPRGGGH